MDENVLAAMARWPGVPDVFGWLSLSERGQWRLHPQGDALETAHSKAPGEEIGSPAIVAFINRNYAGDASGRWYFQNGPQRVFVRLDAAPYILRTAGPELALITHNGLAAAAVSAWVLDDLGRLYAQTEHGPGLVAGRDLPALLEALRTEGGEPLVSALEHAGPAGPIAVRRHPAPGAAGIPPAGGRSRAESPDTVSLHRCAAGSVAAELGFQCFPTQRD